jgi:hypothetical protein
VERSAGSGEKGAKKGGKVKEGNGKDRWAEREGSHLSDSALSIKERRVYL